MVTVTNHENIAVIASFDPEVAQMIADILCVVSAEDREREEMLEELYAAFAGAGFEQSKTGRVEGDVVLKAKGERDGEV